MMQRKERSPYRRAKIVTWLSASLVVAYALIGAAWAYASVFRPDHATWALLLERCLAILTPLVVVVLDRFLRPGDKDDWGSDGDAGQL